MKRNYEKLKARLASHRAWKERSVKKAQAKSKTKPKRRIPKATPKRRSENITYGKLRKAFLGTHPICIITGQRATQIHHIAKRYGQWLNLIHYWVAVSLEGHQIIEDHKDWATSRMLMYRANHGYREEIFMLKATGHNPDEPIIYVDKANLRAIMEDVKNKNYLNLNPS